MSVKITIPNTSSDYLTFGSANTPDAAKIGGYEDSTGNGHLELYTTASGTSTERMRIDASGNVGIGTSSPDGRLQLNTSSGDCGFTINTASTSSASLIKLKSNGTETCDIFYGGSGYGAWGGANSLNLLNLTAGPIVMFTNTTERMRIDSSGNVLVNQTSQTGSAGVFAVANTAGSGGVCCVTSTNNNTYYPAIFKNASNSNVGNINCTASATAYATSSDYRLKENIAPMTGALDKVTLLKPVTYKWKVDGSDGEGFIAHELAEVCPQAVSGEKDAVDADGNPIYQGIDTSFLVATLTAAIKELKAELDTVKSELATLKGTV